MTELLTTLGHIKLGGACIFCGVISGTPHKDGCQELNRPKPKPETAAQAGGSGSITTAPKDKTGKPDWTIFPFEEAESVLKVFAYGASTEKYRAPFTYRKGKGITQEDSWAATFRHMLRIRAGQDIDMESYCYHWAHIAANALMAISALLKKK